MENDRAWLQRPLNRTSEHDAYRDRATFNIIEIEVMVTRGRAF